MLISWMGDIIIIYLIQNILLFSIIFWLLTWGAEYFFKKTNATCQKQFYECGFRTLSELNFQINIHFTMICVFLVLYDVEFIFLYPIIFNYFKSTLFEICLALLFILFIFLSLLYDWKFNALSWQY